MKNITVLEKLAKNPKPTWGISRRRITHATIHGSVYQPNGLLSTHCLGLPCLSNLKLSSLLYWPDVEFVLYDMLHFFPLFSEDASELFFLRRQAVLYGGLIGSWVGNRDLYCFCSTASGYVWSESYALRSPQAMKGIITRFAPSRLQN